MKKITLLLALFFATVVAFNSCRKDETSETPPPTGSNPNLVQATVTGIVMDESNSPVTGVAVSASGITASTDINGIFILSGGLVKERCILQLSKPGYRNRAHAFIPVANTVNYVRIVLMTVPSPQPVSAATGGTVTLSGGASVQFQPNSFISASDSTPYSGMVNVEAKHLAVSNPNFGQMIPGGDLAGVNAVGDDVSLYSFGMVDVVLKSSTGQTLQLAAGTTATITFPIAASQQSTAAATIPLWYFDETTALWKEEGQAAKVGTNYVATVAHFSVWNCDYPGERANVEGRVVDCEGIPMTNVMVTINGGVTVVTDQFGNYATWVPAGWALDFQVLPQGSIVLPSQVENVAPLLPGQTYTVPDLVVPCGSFLLGNLTDCLNQVETGFVALFNNGQLMSSVYTTSGAFRLMAPANASLSLKSISSSGYLVQSVTSGNPSDSVNLGTIQLCNNATTSNSFVVNGGGYSNVTVNIFDEISNEADSIYPNTFSYIYGNSNLGLTSMSFIFPGNQPISIDLSTTIPDSSCQIQFGGFQYAPHQSVPFILNVTYYGLAGDSIKGNFSGTLFSSPFDPIGVAITNGKFAFLRVN